MCDGGDGSSGDSDSDSSDSSDRDVMMTVIGWILSVLSVAILSA